MSVRLATRRLAILDLGPAGHQPMRTADEAVCIAYNGEIYNEPERDELRAKGISFALRATLRPCSTPTRRTAPTPSRASTACSPLPCTARRHERLVLARDRMGIKPLYYHWDGSADCSSRPSFGPCSATAASRCRPTPTRWSCTSRLGVPSPYSLIQGVRKLPPGSYLTVGADGELRVHQYWTPSCPEPLQIGRTEAAERVRYVVRDAVGARCAATFPSASC